MLGMSNPTREQLMVRVAELEEELSEREADLRRFRSELTDANARLEAVLGRLESELKVAQVMQKVLVPTEFPHISGFEFSTKFVPSSISGGDYFDIFEHEDRFRFGMIVSSATGHTMSALLLSVLLHMTGQLESKKGSEPHEAVRDFLDQLKNNIQRQDTADIFYSLIDRRSFEMRYVKMGSVLVLHQNASTGEVRALGGETSPLGLDFSPPKQSESLYLNPRDRVLICTRGVMDVTNKQGEKYGLERVTRSFLSGPARGVHEMRNHILYEVSRFAVSPELERDQTVLVIEVKDKVIKLAKS